MTNRQRTPQGGRAADARRKQRRRPTPKWLASSQGLDAVARSRCLMVLSVLSGEKPVTEAIAQAKISRPTYYQLETRALSAMLSALNPLASGMQKRSPDLSAAAARIEELLARVEKLEQDKRRTQRLLLLTRKSIWGPVTTGRRGRPPKSALLSSTPSGATRSRRSKAKATPENPSILTKAGENSP